MFMWRVDDCGCRHSKQIHGLETKALFPLLNQFDTSQAAQNEAAQKDKHSKKGREAIYNLGAHTVSGTTVL